MTVAQHLRQIALDSRALKAFIDDGELSDAKRISRRIEMHAQQAEDLVVEVEHDAQGGRASWTGDQMTCYTRAGASTISGHEWVDERGDTTTLLRWAVHVPSGRWLLVPIDSPSVMVW